jgi:dihydroorotase
VSVIRGGTVVDQRGRRSADVVIDDESGAIVAVDPASIDLTGGRELDATGCLVAPGLVDLHAHLRQPGQEGAETIGSAARAAALGGYTAVVAMPDCDPCVDSAAVVNEILALAKGALCRIVPAAALTVGRRGDALAPLGELAGEGIRLFTDAGRSLQDVAVARRALDYLAGVAAADRVEVVAADPCQLDALADGAVMHEGEWSSRLGLPGQPAEAEELAVARNLALARMTGCRVHLQGLSTARSVALLRAARVEGLTVTAEVFPHHLVLTHAACAGFDPRTKVSPPLRTGTDVEALRAAVADGTIDAIATDHGPATADATERPFDQAPFGVIGLETTLGLLLTELDVEIDILLAALSWRPAAIAGVDDRHGGPIEPGRAANLVVIDPNATWTVDPHRGASRSANTPFAGRTFTGAVRHTIYEGEPVVVDGGATR